MEKTVRQWLKDWDKVSSVGQKALANLKQQDMFNSNLVCAKLSTALSEAFIWNRSPERHNYWSYIHDVLITNPHYYDDVKLYPIY